MPFSPVFQKKDPMLCSEQAAEGLQGAGAAKGTIRRQNQTSSQYRGYLEPAKLLWLKIEWFTKIESGITIMMTHIHMNAYNKWCTSNSHHPWLMQSAEESRGVLPPRSELLLHEVIWDRTSLWSVLIVSSLLPGLCWEQPWLCTALLSSSYKHQQVTNAAFLLEPKHSMTPEGNKSTPAETKI